MRNPKGWLVCVMAVAIGLVVLGSPPRASADFVLALQADGGPITVVATAPSFTPVTASGIFGNYTYTFFSAVATNSALDSNLLSSTTQIQALTADPHTLSLYVSNQDYTLPADTLLTVRSGLGGTYGSTPGFIGAATFQMWADAGNGLLNTSGTFTNGLQIANPASGNAVTFDTGVDPTGIFTRLAGLPYSVTNITTITTSGLGNVNYSNHVRLAAAVPEPGLLLVGLMGVSGLGLYIGLRRKR